jgi:hypothetical protein
LEWNSLITQVGMKLSCIERNFPTSQNNTIHLSLTLCALSAETPKQVGERVVVMSAMMTMILSDWSITIPCTISHLPQHMELGNISIRPPERIWFNFNQPLISNRGASSA